MMPGPVLVTGGAGFIGGALCRLLVARGYRVINADKLTYSANLASLRAVESSPGYRFYRADIADAPAMLEIMQRERVGCVAHLAAETHVDRSIDGPAMFVHTNVLGTSRLLDAASTYFRLLDDSGRAAFRFLHVSTDEVFGDLPDNQPPFDEDAHYRPSSPYAASKAAADHLVRAWQRTYGLPTLISSCSNNYGPFQFPEKLIPLTILNAFRGSPLPVYGDGTQVRDWLHVDDHARALLCMLERGAAGETYLVGGRAERTNLEVVESICDLLDRHVPLASGGSRRALIRFVADRPGHDRRYALNPGKLERRLGWRALESFDEGLAGTVDWYLTNPSWWRTVEDEARIRRGLGE